MNRLYSFVLPAYKARFLKEAIDSILAQKYQDFELIIVNDNSPEDLDSIVESYDNPKIQYYVNKENIGGRDLVAQWNHSITYANGDYLILASDDDVYDEDYLVEMDKLVTQYPHANVLRPRVRYINSYNEVLDFCGCCNEYSSGLEYLLYLTRGWICSGVPFYMFKRKALLDIGGFANYPIAWFSDDATAIRLSNDGIITSPKILFSFRTSGINISSKCNTKSEALNKLIATEKFYYEAMNYINTFEENTYYDVCMKRSLQSEVSDNMHNKLVFVLKRSKFIVFTRLLWRAIKLPFVYPHKMIFQYILQVFR